MKVLIVDDESHVRDAIQLLLEWEKYGFDTVLTADNVEDAINILQDERPELLIVDVSDRGCFWHGYYELY